MGTRRSWQRDSRRRTQLCPSCPPEAYIALAAFDMTATGPGNPPVSLPPLAARQPDVILPRRSAGQSPCPSRIPRVSTVILPRFLDSSSPSGFFLISLPFARAKELNRSESCEGNLLRLAGDIANEYLSW